MSMSQINLLTATVENEIKSNDPRYRPYDDFVMPRYMNILLYRDRLYDDLVILQYMTILLYRSINDSAGYIYLYAVQLTFSAPLALQGALHH